MSDVRELLWLTKALLLSPHNVSQVEEGSQEGSQGMVEATPFRVLGVLWFVRCGLFFK